MSLNKVMLIGNCGKDPDVKTLDNGHKVANFTIDTTDKGYTTREGTQIPDRTEWHNVVVWAGLAKVVEQYVKKGTKLFVEGKLRTRNYDDANGVKRYTTEVYVDNLELLGGKPESQQAQQAQPQAQQQVQQQAQHQSQYGAWCKPLPEQNTTPPDDLPF